MPASRIFLPCSSPAALQRAAVAAVVTVSAALALTGCAGTPLQPFSTETPPLVLVPASQAGIADQRGRFREVLCAVLQARAAELPDHRPCEDALTRLGTEPMPTGKPVHLGAANRRLVAGLVPGIGFDCVEQWMQPAGTLAQHVGQYGYGLVQIKVDALSGISKNAAQIRAAVMAMPPEPGPPRLVLIGYSKGAPDLLEALVKYPELRSRLAAVVSVGGAIGGSPLANEAEQYQAELLRLFPGAKCDKGDGGGVESLRPHVRQAWLAHNPLPKELPTYSVVSLPQPERLSSILRLSANKLGMIDGRNDGQLLFYDQLIPGSSLLGYANADHWAIALPIARSHAILGSLVVTQNAYPREAFLEALLRFVEEDLAQRRP